MCLPQYPGLWLNCKGNKQKSKVRRGTICYLPDLIRLCVCVCLIRVGLCMWLYMHICCMITVGVLVFVVSIVCEFSLLTLLFFHLHGWILKLPVPVLSLIFIKRTFDISTKGIYNNKYNFSSNSVYTIWFFKHGDLGVNNIKINIDGNRSHLKLFNEVRAKAPMIHFLSRASLKLQFILLICIIT